MPHDLRRRLCAAARHRPAKHRGRVLAAALLVATGMITTACSGDAATTPSTGGRDTGVSSSAATPTPTPSSAAGPEIVVRTREGDAVTYRLFDDATWKKIGESGVVIQASLGTIDQTDGDVDVKVSSSLGAGLSNFDRLSSIMDKAERERGERQRQPDRTATDGSPVYLFAGSQGERRTYEIGGYIGDRDYSIGVEFTGPIAPAEADALVDSLIATIGPA